MLAVKRKRGLFGFQLILNVCSAFRVDPTVSIRAFASTRIGQAVNQGAYRKLISDQDLDKRIRKTVEEDKNVPYVPPEFQREFIGNRKIVEQITKMVDKILQLEYIPEKAVAFVHTGARGVGKTFTAMCLAELMQDSTVFAKQDVRFVSAYIGLDFQMGLTNEEKQLIETGEIDDYTISRKEERMARVIRARLILVLTMMLKHNDIYKKNPFKNDSTDAQPMMPIEFDKMPYSDLLKLLHQLESDVLGHEIIELCSELSDIIGEPLVIVINLDEAQILDELVIVQDKPEGVRFALQSLRCIQRAIYYNRNCLLLPIATGINPATALPHDAGGRNIGLDAAVVTRADFREIGVKFFPSMDKHKLLFLTDVMYPRIRDLMDSKGVIPLLATDERRSYQEVMRILVAGFGGSRVESKFIPRLMTTRDSRATTGAPILDALLWPWLCHQIVRPGIPELELPIQLPFDVNDDSQYQDSYYDFEKLACRVLSFTLDLFSKIDFDYFDLIRDYDYLKLGEFWDVFYHHQGVGVLGPCKTIIAENTANCFQPFSKLETHESSYKSPLNEQFINAVKQLKLGESFLYFCEGSAMLDYIFVYKLAEPTDDANGKLVMRYGASKHSKISKPLSSGDIQKLKEFASKLHDAITARAQHDFLNSSTGLTYNVSPDYKEAFIITNVDQRHEGITVLSPATFQFPPWTTMLFNRPSSSEIV